MIKAWIKSLSGASRALYLDEPVDPVKLAEARERVHQLLRPKPATPINQTEDELFATFVRINRANGVDPTLGDEAEGRVGYPHQTLVPMQGDTYWGQGRTISRRAIDRQFKKLAI